MPRPLLALFAVLLALPAAGCGATSGPGDVDRATVMLDFAPNAVHAGLYMTLARDYDGSEGVRLRIRTPGASTDAVRLLETGRIDFAVLDISDLALARQRGSDLVGVMALVQRPLAAVLARPEVRRPRDLEGRRAGVTGLPSDVAVLSSIVRGDGGRPRAVRRTTIGFTAVAALVSGRVDAATGFWNVEGLALGDRLPGAREFRVERFGAPAYPELVLTTTRQALDDDPRLARGLVTALRRGYAEILNDPESAVSEMTRRVRGSDRVALLEGLRAVQPAFTAGVPRYGVFDPRRLRAWARWARRFGIVSRRVDVERAFAFDVANGA